MLVAYIGVKDDQNTPKEQLSKSSVLLGLSLTVPFMVACLSIAIPIWIRNGYQFWSSRAENAGRAGNHLTLGMKEVVSEWMRPTDIVKEKHLGNHPCLFSGVANSSDVCQGRLGDCWFLSAVAVLTEVSRISEVIITPEYNQEGIYTVRFCIQASENEGYAGCFEHVNEVGHSARFDENYDSSTHLSKNGKYQAENTGYDRDSERVNKSVPECLEAEAKLNLSAGNSAFNDPEVSSGSKANVLNQHKSTEKQPIARKVVTSRASCTEKVSHRLYQSVNRKRNVDCSFDLRCAMCRKRKKQRSNSYGEISISKQLPCLPSTVNLTTTQKKLRFLRVQKLMYLNQHKSTEEQPIPRKVVSSRASCTEKVSHRLYQSVNRDKESVNSCQPVMKKNGSSFHFKTEERARKRKVHAKEEETR
ncbi:hypothetical protein BC332_34030 [Capsicum chinense]|nr:hypothetical protein BC332_34030 [Capsicum chinense]